MRLPFGLEVSARGYRLG